jgi:DNA-directed RNA polymerase subunit beta
MIETPYAVVKDGKITGEIKYLNALEEEQFNIAHAATLVEMTKLFLRSSTSATRVSLTLSVAKMCTT